MIGAFLIYTREPLITRYFHHVMEGQPRGDGLNHLSQLYEVEHFNGS